MIRIPVPAIIICMLLALCPADALSRKERKKIPAHPSQIAHPALDWKVPLGSPYRRTLKNGMRAYIARDRALPLVRLIGYVRAGSLNDPAGKEGLGDLTFALLKSGGAGNYPPDTLDALLEKLAIRVSFSLGESQGAFSASFLSEFADTALYLLSRMLFEPAFDPKRIEQERGIAIEDARHRFDDPGPTLSAAYRKTMYPRGANSRLVTEASLSSITREDILAFHGAACRTDNIILGISGDFDENRMAALLERLFPAAGATTAQTKFPVPAVSPAYARLMVHKPISQAYVQIGLPLFKRPHPDYYAVSVLNLVLGGSSFISRLGTTVRSDQGLTYSIHSDAESNYIYPGTLSIRFFTKSESVDKAIALCIAETQKVIDSGVTDDELESAKKILIDALPSMFRGPDDIVDNYAWSEYYGRPDNHFVVYPDKIRALTKKDIAAAARKYLLPQRFTYVVVGDTASILRPSAADKFSLGKIQPSRIINPQQIESLGNE